MYRQYHAAGGKHPVCVNQGRGHYTVRGYALYADVLRRYFSRIAAGNLCVLSQYVSADGGGADLKDKILFETMLF